MFSTVDLGFRDWSSLAALSFSAEVVQWFADSVLFPESQVRFLLIASREFFWNYRKKFWSIFQQKIVLSHFFDILRKTLTYEKSYIFFQLSAFYRATSQLWSIPLWIDCSSWLRWKLGCIGQILTISYKKKCTMLYNGPVLPSVNSSLPLGGWGRIAQWIAFLLLVLWPGVDSRCSQFFSKKSSMLPRFIDSALHRESGQCESLIADRTHLVLDSGNWQAGATKNNKKPSYFS